MVQLQTNLKAIEATGGQVVALSYDAPTILSRFAAKESITYPLLSDAASKVIEAYGILDSEAPARWRGIPHPGTFIVGTNGMIHSKLFLSGYRDRHPPEALIEALEKAR